jgi:hypothetical protein
MDEKMNAQERLIQACQTGDIGGIREALADGAEVDDVLVLDEYRWSALELTAKNGHLKATNYLIDLGAPLNVGAPFDPLWWAVFGGHEEVVILLWDRGERYNAEGAMRFARPAPRLGYTRTATHEGDARA